MKRVFADTSYWIAVINRRDELAGRAQEVRSSLGRVRIVTTQEGLAELLNEFSEKHGPHLRSVAVAENASVPFSIGGLLEGTPPKHVTARNAEDPVFGVSRFRSPAPQRYEPQI